MSEQKLSADAIGATRATTKSTGGIASEAPRGGASEHESGVPLPSPAEEQAALRRVATLVAQGAKPEAVFAAVAKEARLLLTADIATIDRFDPGDLVTVVALVGAARESPAIGTATPTAQAGNAARVRATGRSARIDRYSEQINPIGYQAGFRAAASAPIDVGGHLWGAITVASTAEGKPFPPGTEERLAHFTALAALAIANAQAREELEAVADEQAALRRVATLVAEGAPRDEVYAAVTEEIAGRQGADVVALLRYEADGTATVVGGWGVEGIEVPLGERMLVAGAGVAIAVRRARRPAYVQRLEGPPGSAAAWLSGLGIQSGIGSPIVVEDELWGVVVAASRRPEVLPAGSEARIAEFTELVATAIANAEARDVLRHLADEQTALRRVATLVARGVAPEAIFAAVAEEVATVLPGIDLTSIGRYTPEQSVEFVGAWSRMKEADWVGKTVPIGGRNVATLVFETGQPARVDQFEDDGTALSAIGRGRGTLSVAGAPITVEGQVWGMMTVGSAHQDRLPAEIENELAGFIELVATAIANADAQAELTASRARIVASADNERRRIVRDLHDGAQQRLVHTIITLKLARRAQEAGDDRSAGGLMGEALEHAEHANEELRGLVHGIMPSTLTRGGLAAAVAELTAQLRIPVDLEVTSDRLTAEIEANAYFVITEALTNVVKHSGAQSGKVCIQVVDRALKLDVHDNGIGGARPDGSGLRGVADRIVALGGRLEIDSPDRGGTRLSATLPLPD